MGVHMHTHRQHTTHTSLIADIDVSFSRLYRTLPSSRLLPQSDFIAGSPLEIFVDLCGSVQICADLNKLFRSVRSEQFAQICQI